MLDWCYAKSSKTKYFISVFPYIKTTVCPVSEGRAL